MKTKEEKALYQKRYKEKNREKLRLYNIKHRETYSPEYNKLRQQKLKERRLIIINHYTQGRNCCSCCGENNLFFLSIDHKENNGNKHREQLKMRRGGSGRFYKWIIDSNFPNDLQILCYNCNLGKARNMGICPHTLSPD